MTVDQHADPHLYKQPGDIEVLNIKLLCTAYCSSQTFSRAAWES